MVARDGYAVGSLKVGAGDQVCAVQVVFMKVKSNGALDPKSSYASEWIAEPSGAEARQVASRGATVLGFQGRRGGVIDAVGLMLAEK